MDVWIGEKRTYCYPRARSGEWWPLVGARQPRQARNEYPLPRISERTLGWRRLAASE